MRREELKPVQYEEEITPFHMKTYPEGKDCVSFNKAIDQLLTPKLKEEKKPTENTQKSKLENIKKQQEMQIEGLKKSIEQNKIIAEKIYENYQVIAEVLESLNKARKKYSWKEIKDKLKGNKIIKQIDAKNKKVVLELK